MMPLRMARQRAIAERKQYIVCFGVAAPAGAITPIAPTAQSIQIFRWDAGTALSAAAQVTAVTLPNDIQFQTLAGLPNGAATVPDGFGNATVAIDLDQGVAGGGIKNQVMFMPDGSAHDVNGNLNSGIVYVARNGDLFSSRAVTLYGATGRIRGWRLIKSGGAIWFATMTTGNRVLTAKKYEQQGFALLETLIAIVVLMIGLLAVLATFAMAIGNTKSVQNDSIARQKAAEAVESIYTARQTGQITFDKIQNVGAGNGIFTVGFTAMTDAGPDGLDNTGDDVPAVPVRLPGPSGVIKNTTAGRLGDLGNFTRQVPITNVPGNPNVDRLPSACVIRYRRAGTRPIRCSP